MKIELKNLNGHWLLIKDGDTKRAFVVNASDESAAKLLLFLDVGAAVNTPSGIRLTEGEFTI